MDSFKKTITRNARLIIEDQFMKAFESVPEDKLEPLTKHLGNLRLCFQLAEEAGSYRHLHMLIPRLLKEAEQHYGITFDLPNDFKELMESR